jgi:hypothetical protein
MTRSSGYNEDSEIRMVAVCEREGRREGKEGERGG